MLVRGFQYRCFTKICLRGELAVKTIEDSFPIGRNYSMIPQRHFYLYCNDKYYGHAACMIFASLQLFKDFLNYLP